MTIYSDRQERYKSARRKAADRLALDYLAKHPRASRTEIRNYLHFKHHLPGLLASRVAWHITTRGEE